jgi:dTDP-glucose 4,6-dehydratase
MVKSDKSVAERTDRTKFLTQKPDAAFDSIHDPVNIGNPRELTVRGIAEIILKLTGSKSVIEERPLPADDPKVRRPDITRAKSLLGWEPKVELEDGIRKATEYFRQVVVK